MVVDHARRWVQQVVQCTQESLPEAVRHGVHACGEAAGPWLHEALLHPDVRRGVAVEHVLQLLSELRYEPALLPIVDLIVDEPFWAAPAEAIARYGAEAVPTLLLLVGRDPAALLEPLAVCATGTRDPDVREALVAHLWDLPGLAAQALVHFGDPGAVPALLSRLATLTIDRRQLFAGQAVLEVVAAVEHLGGDPGALGRQRIAEVEAARRPHGDRIGRLHDGLQEALLAG